MVNPYASTDFEGTKGNGLLGLMQAPASLNFDNISRNRAFAVSEIECPSKRKLENSFTKVKVSSLQLVQN